MKFHILLKSFSIALLLMLLCGPVWAACTGSSPTWTTDGNERADVAECVTAASSGDTINVIAGDGAATWTSAVSLPSSKDLSIIGPTVVSCTGTEGSASYACTSDDALVVTCNSGCFELNQAANHRVSGFAMVSNNLTPISWPNNGEQDAAKHFRVDHNRITMSPADWEFIRPTGGLNEVHPQGIFDHNLCTGGCAITVFGTIYYWDEGGFAAQNALWAQQTAFGDSSGVIYIEANHFSGGITNYYDHNHGSRVVARFNRLVGNGSLAWMFEIHGVQYDNRGAQRTEVYHNAATGTGSGFSELRGGAAIYFNNTSSEARDLHLTIDRSEYDEGAGTFETVKECGTGGSDGDSPSGVDQKTTGENGWRCRDQVGIWYDITEWGGSPSVSPTSFNAWNQQTRPLYIWGNTSIDIVVNTQGDIENKIVVDREFYCDSGFASGCNNGVRSGTFASIPATCTVGMAYWATDRGKWRKDTSASAADGVLYRCSSTNTWTTYFIPYQYPHNWIDGDDEPSDMTFGDSSGTTSRLAIFLANWAWLALAGLLGGIMYATTFDRPRAAFASAATRIRARVFARRNPNSI